MQRVIILNILKKIKFKRYVSLLCILALLIGTVLAVLLIRYGSENTSTANIKYVDMNASYPALKKALDLDIKSHTEDSKIKLNWLEILAYITAKNGNSFSGYKSSDIDTLVKKLNKGKSMAELSKGMKYYNYYLEIYNSIFGEYVGEYSVQTLTEYGTYRFDERYGLKAFFPLAKGYAYTHYDDFGAKREYGYQRPHLGHDLLSSLGTPVIAVESGIIEEMGWNEYGGWRIGIRSFDQTRYYYYAHLRKNHPFRAGLKKGDTVTAGDVIGYVGRTGYSKTENTDGMEVNHLHLGVQLIFDEKTKDTNEIWIDLYAICKLLSQNSTIVERNNAIKEYDRKYDVIIPSAVSASDSKATEEEGISVPVMMYHSITPKPQSGNLYEITPDALEQDLKYIKEHNFNTVNVEDLRKYVYEGVDLPPNPIMLTFDDGFYNNVYYGLPLLKEYGCKAVLSFVGQYSEANTQTGDINPKYSYLTWDQVKDVYADGTIELQNHTWDMHGSYPRNGSKRKKWESMEDYSAAFKGDITKLQDKIQELTGYKPIAFTYPYGAISPESKDLLKEMGFVASFSCYEGVSKIVENDPDCLFGIKRFRRDYRRPLSSLVQ
jgi:peptidoglycan/xylan/chitin deacetylase (PgdA/CDA1 family)